MRFLSFRTFLSSESGFSLLEVAIVLSVLGVLGTLALPMLSQYRERQALQITQEHQKRALEALESYLLQHQLLPAPADPKETSDQFAAGSSNPDMPNKKGIIPYRTLGLPERIAKDGYGHYMTYVVADDACLMKIDNRVPDFCEPYHHNKIEIQDRSKESILNFSEQNDIAFVLISHGPQGPQSTYVLNDSAEKINNEANYENDKITFVIHPYSIHPDHPFRHQIQWGTQQGFAGFCKTKKTEQVLKQANEKLKEILKPFKDFLAQHPERYSAIPSSTEEENISPSSTMYQQDSRPSIIDDSFPETQEADMPLPD